MSAAVAAAATAQSVVAIKCRKCRQEGSLTWEDFRGELVLIAISGGFYERVSKKALPFKIELVCGECGAIQPTT